VIAEHGKTFGITSLCSAFSEPRSWWYRLQKPRIPAEPRRSIRRLSEVEEADILETMNAERFQDMAPGEIYTVLLDEGKYVCSNRTMYRILARHDQTVVRWQSAPKTYKRPELLASRPNELWSWDITKLKGPKKWTYFYLYTIIDVYSRYVVGWMVAYKESAELAKALIEETCRRQDIVPGTLTVHADNGGSMTSLAVAQLLADLGVTKTHSRPHVSNDNPFSESAFKTLKYRPDFPERFMTIQEARMFCQKFFRWYNLEHRHSGIAMLTPLSVHYQQHAPVLKARTSVLAKAYELHPERFVKGVPTVKTVPEHVWINPPIKEAVGFGG
jgi:putative transposase